MARPFRWIAKALREEGGFALASVVFLGGVMILLTAIIVVRAGSQANIEVNDGRWEQSLHVAEGTMDNYLAELVLVTDPDAETTGHTASQLSSKAAIIAAAETLAAFDPSSVRVTPEGEAVILKPSDDSVIYAVGFTPNLATAGHKVRVIEIDYDFGVVGTMTPNWTSVKAVLAGNDLTITGSANVDHVPPAIAADVHANGALAQSAATRISGCGTESEDSGYTQPPCPVSQINYLDIPIVDARTAHYLSHWDLCPDGAHYGPNHPTSPSGTAGTPCSGPLTANPFGWSGGGSAWTIANKAALDGVFYVYGADVSGKPGFKTTTIANATIIVERDYGTSAVDAPDVLPVCDSGTGGGLTLNAQSNLQGHSSAVVDSGDSAGLAIITEGYTHLSGGATIGGLVFAREGWTVNGTSDITGAVTVLDMCDDGVLINGTFDIHYTGPITTTFDFVDTTTTGTGEILIIGRTEV